VKFTNPHISIFYNNLKESALEERYKDAKAPLTEANQKKVKK
jgi:hypothetical protein